jgi:hypothetical protein
LVHPSQQPVRADQIQPLRVGLVDQLLRQLLLRPLPTISNGRHLVIGLICI